MYLHLGQDVVVKGDEIIGIFDLDKTSVSALTKDFLKRAQKNKSVSNVSDPLALSIPKSFVLCRKRTAGGVTQVVYISPISPATLKKRGESYG